MRTLGAVVTLMALGLLCPSLWSDDKDKDKDIREVVVERIQELNLSDEQEAKIADIRKDYEPKVKEAAKELATIVKEEEDDIRNVLTPDQKDKLKNFKEERKEHAVDGLASHLTHLKELDLTDDEIDKIGAIRKEFRPKIEKCMENFKGTLTPEQIKAHEEAVKAGKSHKEIMQALNLSDEQKKKVSTACKEMSGTVKEEMDKIKDVLTEEQKAKLADLKEERKERVRDRWAQRVSNLKELDLTDDQKAKIHDIRMKYRPKVQEAGNKLRETVTEEVKKILAVIKE